MPHVLPLRPLIHVDQRALHILDIVHFWNPSEVEVDEGEEENFFAYFDEQFAKQILQVMFRLIFRREEKN